MHTIDLADKFATGGVRTEHRADDLLNNGNVVIGGLGLVSNLIVAILFVLLSLNANRAGVLSRFMSIVGVIVGASAVLLAGGSLVIEVFWLGAVAVLFLDRWPGDAARPGSRACPSRGRRPLSAGLRRPRRPTADESPTSPSRRPAAPRASAATGDKGMVRCSPDHRSGSAPP